MDSIVLMICVWQQGAVVAATWVCGVLVIGSGSEDFLQDG